MQGLLVHHVLATPTAGVEFALQTSVLQVMMNVPRAFTELFPDCYGNDNNLHFFCKHYMMVIA